MLPFLLRYKKFDGPSHATIIVSTKIDKRATKRNRMKRLLRESLRRVTPVGVDATFIVRQNFAHLKQPAVDTMVEEQLREKVRA